MVIDDIIKKVPVKTLLGISAFALAATGCSGNYDLPIKKGDIVKVDTPYLSFNVQDPDAQCGGGYCDMWVHLTPESVCKVLDIDEFERDTFYYEGIGLHTTPVPTTETAYDIRLKCWPFAEDSESLNGIGHLGLTRAELNSVIYPVSMNEALK